MRRPPRSARRRLLGARPFALAILEGMIALVFTLSIYAMTTAMEAPEARTRLLSFTAIVIANLSLILFARGGGPRLWRHVAARNRSLWTIVAATATGYAIVLAVPALRELFRLSAPIAADAWVLGIATCMLWVALAALGLAYERIAVTRPAGQAVR